MRPSIDTTHYPSIDTTPTRSPPICLGSALGDAHRHDTAYSRVQDIVVELKPLPGSGQHRVLRLHIANRIHHGAVRDVIIYVRHGGWSNASKNGPLSLPHIRGPIDSRRQAPYWLINHSALPLVYREVRLGTGRGNAEHAMEGRSSFKSGSSGQPDKMPTPGMSEQSTAPAPASDRDASDREDQVQHPALSEVLGEVDGVESATEEPADMEDTISLAAFPRSNVSTVDDSGEVHFGVAARGAPVLFSYAKHDIFLNRLSVRTHEHAGIGSKPSWSKPFSTEALNTQQAIRVGGHELSFDIVNAPLPATRTKIVTFAPRYILENKLRFPIAYRQAAAPNAAKLLPPSERTPFHWPAHRAEQTMQIALTAPQTMRPALFSEAPSAVNSVARADASALGAPAAGWFKHGGGGAVNSPTAMSGMHLSTFSGSFRIDEPGEVMLLCGESLESYVDVYEYQRRGVLGVLSGKEFGEFSASALLPTDYHGAWADERMEIKYASLTSVEPHEGWRWLATSEWHVSSTEIIRERSERGEKSEGQRMETLEGVLEGRALEAAPECSTLYGGGLEASLDVTKPAGGSNVEDGDARRASDRGAERSRSAGTGTVACNPSDNEAIERAVERGEPLYGEGRLFGIPPPPPLEDASPLEDPAPPPVDDEVGWEYAVNWDRPWGCRSLQTFVRRRRWSRRRELIDSCESLRERFVALDVSMEGPSVLITMSDGATRPPPYIIENRSKLEASCDGRTQALNF